MLKALDALGVAKWPSLVLILVVPALSYGSGWDSGAGVHRTPRGQVHAGGRPFRLWQGATQGGETQWCAQPLGETPPPLQLDFRHGGGRTAGQFDAGQFCAVLPAAAGLPRLVAG